MLSYLGQLSPRKGVDHLIAAFSALNHPTAWLMIAETTLAPTVSISEKSQPTREYVSPVCCVVRSD